MTIYNLVPSCHLCSSSLKGDIDFLEEHINPFETGFDNKFK